MLFGNSTFAIADNLSGAPTIIVPKFLKVTLLHFLSDEKEISLCFSYFDSPLK